MISTADILLLVSTVVSVGTAVVGIQLYLLRQVAMRLDKLEVAVHGLNVWHDQWRNLPPDIGSATMLDRRLAAIEHRLDQIEDHVNVGKDPTYGS